MGAACYNIGAKVVTLSRSVNFIRNTAEKCRVIATATLIHVGHSTIVCRVDIEGPDGRKMVDVTGTMFVVLAILTRFPKSGKIKTTYESFVNTCLTGGSARLDQEGAR